MIETTLANMRAHYGPGVFAYSADAEASGTAPQIALAARNLHNACQETLDHAVTVRDALVASLASQGLTLEQIGHTALISKQRAHQILKRS